MDSQAQRGGGGYLIPALGVVIGSTIALFILSHILLILVAEGSSQWLRSGPREAVTLIVAATTLALLGVFYLRTQYADPAQVTASIPTTMRVAPLVAAVVFIPLAYDPALLKGSASQLIPRIAPVVAATWSSALIVALLCRRVLHMLAVRRPPETMGTDTVSPPTLAGSFGRTLGGSALAAAMLVVGAALSRPELFSRVEWSRGAMGMPAAGLLIMVIVAAVAGSSLGQSPGRDAVSIGRRLDALGYNTRKAMAWPVVVTSFDEVGELFSRLEELRLRLAREVTLYQEALDRTKDADVAKSEFLGAVSHELRTPLNSVCGFAQLLLEGDKTTVLTEPQAEDVRLIQAGGEQLLELINDILDMSMIETGELGLMFGRQDIAQVVEEVVRIHQPLVRDSDVELIAEVGRDLPHVSCDRRRIGQVITNLISNAIKFTESGSITVRASFDTRQKRIVIRVLDTGVGIAPLDLEAIFEAYRQVGAAKRRKKGTGLGLAIARSIAIHHGGSLTVDSTLGEGSTFTLTLPLDPPRDPSPTLAEAAARAGARPEPEAAT